MTARFCYMTVRKLLDASRQGSHLRKEIYGQNEKKRTKLTNVPQMKNIEILAEHSTLGTGVEIHKIY
jgi:hypothetical protein